MKLSNKDIDILQELLKEKIHKIANGPEGIETHEREEVYINIMRKLDRMYFE